MFINNEDEKKATHRIREEEIIVPSSAGMS